MPPIILHSPAALLLLWLVPVAVLLYRYTAAKRAKALGAFADPEMLLRLLDPLSNPIRRLQTAAACVALALMAIALARPGWNPTLNESASEGRDVIFVLDASKSMLANDTQPSRIEKAKSVIFRGVDKMQGNRVALIAFAGTAEVKCPLTIDYSCFKMLLRNASPAAMKRGGTNLKEGLTTAIEKILDSNRTGMQDVILISDGEDHAGSLGIIPGKLNRLGVRLIVLGLGDESQGSRIPVHNPETDTPTYAQYEGREIWTRLRPEALRRLAGRLDGAAYFNVGTGTIDLGEVYHKLTSNDRTLKTSDTKTWTYNEGFQLFLLLAFLGLLTASWSNIRLRGRTAPRTGPGNHAKLAVYAMLLLPGSLFSGPAREAFTNGLEAYERGECKTAAEHFNRGLKERPDSIEMMYNLGVAEYTSGDAEKASEAFEKSLSFTHRSDEAFLCLYNLGNSLYKIGEKKMHDSPSEALSYFEASARQFRKSLDLAPSSENAAHNLELAWTMVHRLTEDQRREKDTSNEDDESGDSDEQGEKKEPDPDRMRQTQRSSREGKKFLMPTETPEDILEEERRNNEERLKRIEQQDDDVEKDW